VVSPFPAELLIPAIIPRLRFSGSASVYQTKPASKNGRDFFYQTNTSMNSYSGLQRDMARNLDFLARIEKLNI